MLSSRAYNTEGHLPRVDKRRIFFYSVDSNGSITIDNTRTYTLTFTLRTTHRKFGRAHLEHCQVFQIYVDLESIKLFVLFYYASVVSLPLSSKDHACKRSELDVCPIIEKLNHLITNRKNRIKYLNGQDKFTQLYNGIRSQLRFDSINGRVTCGMIRYRPGCGRSTPFIPIRHTRSEMKNIAIIFFLIFASSNAALVITQYSDSSCVNATEAISIPTGCQSASATVDGKSLGFSSGVTLSGGNATYNFYTTASCSGTPADSTTVVISNNCTSDRKNKFYKASLRDTFHVAPGPNDQIKQSYASPTCSGNYLFSKVDYNAGCKSSSSCELEDDEGFEKKVCQTSGDYLFPSPSASSQTAILSALVVSIVLALSM
ncbi:hypothetical protein PROFUN_01028 [Planoprotostelium fungivorum]|uniref:Uncharacterized protein n=1 Tax=Planoprotostelium fungivorum TaxID=1890364 RepID=A0A2P6N4H4_9EUKA|nr:hypothetical protein PROFUN_01028 [Planoprotostelium fungivorum]